jgi:hypothetical protein
MNIWILRKYTLNNPVSLNVISTCLGAGHFFCGLDWNYMLNGRIKVNLDRINTQIGRNNDDSNRINVRFGRITLHSGRIVSAWPSKLV